MADKGPDDWFPGLQAGKAAFEKFAWSVASVGEICSRGKERNRLRDCQWALRDAWTNLLNPASYPQIGPNTGMVGGP